MEISFRWFQTDEFNPPFAYIMDKAISVTRALCGDECDLGIGSVNVVESACDGLHLLYTDGVPFKTLGATEFERFFPGIYGSIGLYLGEVIRVSLDGHWGAMRADQNLVRIYSLEVQGFGIVEPQVKVRKRIANGAEDSLTAYLMAIHHMAGDAVAESN